MAQVKKTRSIPAPGNENVRYFPERLFTSFEAMLKTRLTVVEAPMGYGKTEAVRAFCRKAPVRAIWTRALQTSPESFWPDLCDKLARSIPHAEDLCAALEKLGFPHDSVKDGAARRLLRQLSPEKNTVLVFDDCHFLPPSFIKFCESLAQDDAPDLRFVCITRDAWEGNREVLRLKGFLTYIDRKVLAFTPPEIQEYYSANDVRLSLEAAYELHADTEGWIAALYLFLARHKTGGASSAFSTIPPKVSAPIHINALLEEAVYAPLSAEARDLLFTLAPVERFTAAQASRLSGKNAVSLLKELTGKNAFVVFDAETGAYSVHAIFRQFLHNKFEQGGVLTDARKREIYRACGDVLHGAGELASAMEAWHKAGDFEHALTVLESDMSRNLVTERAALYTAMFRDCPEEILERHMGASFKYAIALFSAGDFPAFGKRLEWLARRCAALPPGNEGDRWRGELHVLLALQEFNDMEAMSGHHRMALDLLKGPTSLYGADSPWTLGSPSALFMFYRESGKLREELRQMRECMPPYYRLTGHHGAGAEFLMEAEAFYNSGEFAAAEKVCAAAWEEAKRHKQIGNMLCALFLHMRLALQAGDAGALFGDGEREGHIAAMRGLIERNQDFFLLHTADLCEGWLYAALNLPGRVPDWLGFKLARDSRLYAFAKGFFGIVHGRVLLLAGKHADVLEDFNDMLKRGAFRDNLLFSIYAHIYLAAAFLQAGDGRKAAETLKTALDAARPDALHMPFAENHDLIGRLLAEAWPGNAHNSVLPRIEALAQQTGASRESIMKSIMAEKPPAILTERALEVVRLAAEGLTNQQIADEMRVSVNTIKTHLNTIRQKTGVKGRAEFYKIIGKN